MSSTIHKSFKLPISRPILSEYLLQSIHKLRILPISQIQPFLILQLHISRPCSKRCLLLVLLVAIPPDECYINEASAVAAYDSNFSRDVARGVFRSEGLGTWKWSVSVVHRATNKAMEHDMTYR